MPATPVPAARGQASDLAHSEQVYRRLIHDNPNHVEAWFQLGLVLLRQRRHAAAIECLEKAAALDPAQEVVHHYLGLCHQALRHLDRAVTHFTRFAQARPESAEVHNNLGITNAQLGRRDQAAACFEQALRVKPDFPEVHNNYGNVLGEQNRLDEAIIHYRKALELRPGYADAHHNLGVVFKRQGRMDDAIACFRQAVTLNPQYVEALLHLADAYRAAGRLDEAAAGYRQLLAVKPDHPDAGGLFAQVLAQQGRLDDAVACLHQSLLFRPDAPETYHTLGLTLARQQRLEEAAAAFRQALRHRPDYPEAHNSLGNTLLRQQRFEEACASYRQAIAARPDFAHAHCNLGIALLQEGRSEEALAAIEEARRLQPDYVEADYNLATALRRLDRLDEAVAMYARVLERRPDHAEAHCGLGAARLQLGEPAAALACFERAIALRPDDADFHTNRALTLLLIADFERGWDEYEWRLKQKRVQPRLVPQPVWDGTPLPGGTILLFAEQGMGDTIQFARYARLVKERVGTVLLECPAPLRGLLAGCPGIDGVVDPEAPAPVVDVQAALMSLPRIFGTRLDTIPAAVPYLFTEPALRDKWRQTLRESAAAPSPPPPLPPRGEGRTMRVGIVWQGNPKLPGDMYRSVKLAQFAALAAVPGVKLFSLQKGTGAEQLAALDGQFALTDLAGQIAADFRDTAAAIENLDLVIAVDTSVAHLAGALGRQVWVLLPFYPDWRWQREGEQSLWYPTMRLFRQRRRGDWTEVFTRVAEALADQTQRSRPAKITIELEPAELIEWVAQLEAPNGDRCKYVALAARLRCALPAGA
jgi:tetratricopeptide (TPR) repeat protein